jgi:hypothetical protein
MDIAANEQNGRQAIFELNKISRRRATINVFKIVRSILKTLIVYKLVMLRSNFSSEFTIK